MELNERTLDRIIKMVNAKFPFIFDLKVTRDRFRTYEFEFIADFELVKEISPESKIDWVHLKRFSENIRGICEVFLDYSYTEHFEDPHYLQKLDHDINEQIFTIIKALTPYRIHSEHNPIKIIYKFV